MRNKRAGACRTTHRTARRRMAMLIRLRAGTSRTTHRTARRRTAMLTRKRAGACRTTHRTARRRTAMLTKKEAKHCGTRPSRRQSSCTAPPLSKRRMVGAAKGVGARKHGDLAIERPSTPSLSRQNKRDATLGPWTMRQPRESHQRGSPVVQAQDRLARPARSHDTSRRRTRSTVPLEEQWT
jgi:hypothetical protein